MASSTLESVDSRTVEDFLSAVLAVVNQHPAPGLVRTQALREVLNDLAHLTNQASYARGQESVRREVRRALNL